MGKQRKRTGGRHLQRNRHIRVHGVRKTQPDAQKLSRVLIGLALLRAAAEAEARATADAADPSTSSPRPRSEADDGQ